MRPILEKLPAQPDASWSRLHRCLDDAIPFQWHHHPEFELTLTSNSRGQRFIGDHVGTYDDGDLVLVGPNLPHTWSSREKVDPARPHDVRVVWFRQEWAERLTVGFVEFRGIGALLSRAGAGLQISPAAARDVRGDVEALFEKAPADRMLGLLDILNRIARDANALTLASMPVRHAGPHEDRDRIDRVLTHIHIHYADDVTLEDLADRAALSPSGLHRSFRRHTQTNVSDYLMRLRIGDACARLSSTEQPIRHIADAVGYRSLANFNRQFRRMKAMTPRAYRSEFRLDGPPRPKRP
jgi:AraC-like DNA-binding protein